MTHILYSFRRCPYAIRARLAIAYSKQPLQLREIILKDKPQAMLALSNKGTVPVLQLSTGEIIDESLDIMVWAISQNDTDNWLSSDIEDMLALINQNDFEFKYWLDRYKYADRFPDFTEQYYRQQCEDFLVKLELRLKLNKHLFSEHTSLADIAILPFIRQFALVDEQWFNNSPYPHLKNWLYCFLDSPLFNGVMKKYPLWLTTNQQHPFP